MAPAEHDGCTDTSLAHANECDIRGATVLAVWRDNRTVGERCDLSDESLRWTDIEHEHLLLLGAKGSVESSR